MHNNVETTIMLGDLSLEDKCLLPKVLLVKLSDIHSHLRLMANKKKGVAQMIYNALRPLVESRKTSYEMRQFCGSSGATNSGTEWNMLRSLAVIEGCLPRKAWVSVIIHSVDRCYAVIVDATRQSRSVAPLMLYIVLPRMGNSSK